MRVWLNIDFTQARFGAFADLTGAINQPTGEIDCFGTPIGATFTCTNT